MFDAYPTNFFQEGMRDLIIVGASDKAGRAGLFSQWGNEVSVWAPGSDVYFPDYFGAAQYEVGRGSSFGTPPLLPPLKDERLTMRFWSAAPAVAGLVAYFRALPGFDSKLQQPAQVKALLKRLSRTVQVGPTLRRPEAHEENGVKYSHGVQVVWNGQIDDQTSCLLTPLDPRCPDIGPTAPSIDDSCSSQPITRRRRDQDGRILAKRQTGPSCQWTPDQGGGTPGNGGGGGNGNGSGGGDGDGGGAGNGQAGDGKQLGPSKTITYSPGPPSPTCTSNCGTLCTDHWCRPDATGQPPHFTDPANLPSGPIGGGGVPANCISSTTSVTCHGAGVGKSCVTATSCLATGTVEALPTLTQAPPFPSNCVQTTSWLECAAGGGATPACVTSSSCLSTAPPPTLTTLIGFPPTSPVANATASCLQIKGLCEKNPGLNAACDLAADDLRLKSKEKYPFTSE